MNRLWSHVVRFGDMPSVSPNENQTDDNVTTFPIALMNATPRTYLEQLNEDCLLEIFSSNSFTLMDLCSLAETCTRFKQITQRVFPKDYGISQRYGGYEFQSKNHEELYTKLQDVERILKNFGPHVSELKISRELDVVDLVAKYCRDVTLKQLEINFSVSIEGVRVKLSSILQRVLKLRFFCCDDFFACPEFNCDSLIELEITNSPACAAIMDHTFPNLERFTWHNWSETWDEADKKNFNDDNSDILFNFIRRHRQLRMINVKEKSVCECKILHVIGSSCKELEKLTLEDFIKGEVSFDFSHLQSLSKLKMLDLDFDDGSFHHHDQPHCQQIEFSQAFKSLETVKITNMIGVPVQIFDVLSQLQNLRELYLKSSCYDRIPWERLNRLRKVHLCDDLFVWTVVTNIITKLINLEELKCELIFNYSHWDEYCLSIEEFSEIVKVARPRERELTLLCYCKFKTKEYCDENQKVRLINLNPYCRNDED